jgi:endonuclease I/chitodextrinase
LLLTLTCGSGFAGAPAGYYDAVDTTTAANLRQSVHSIIDDHTLIPYNATSTDTWNVLELADEDPNDSGRILDVYLNASYQKWGAGNNDYNREHTWPSSYGFPDEDSDVYPYSDCHHLFLCNDSRNISRSNKPYGNTAGAGTEYPTEVNDGVGGGTGVYPGWSNWSNTVYWETWWDRRGDVARALFYMDVRYQGGTHGVTGAIEPDLILTDDMNLIAASNTGRNESVAYMGLLSVLLQWHQDDPPDNKEMNRTDAVFAFQGNRNPFVDHPEWVVCIFTGQCGGGVDLTPPAAPIGLVASAGDGSVNLNWSDNLEFDLAGYEVYRSEAEGGPYSQANPSLLGASQFSDEGLVNGTTYYYIVTARDLSGNESLASAEVNETPVVGGGDGPLAWINEFHYDNTSTDAGEFFEIAGVAGTNLSGWTLIGYNGNGGTIYDTIFLNGTLSDQQAGFGTLSFNMLGMQNGAPDGLALVDETGTLLEFISYEGVVNAIEGVAAGMSSTDIGVFESSATPLGSSLQLAGTGAEAADFVWQVPQPHTSGAVNTGQTFVGIPENEPPVAVANGPYTADMDVSLSFSSAGSFDPDGTIVAWAWTFGDGGSSDEANPNYTYPAAGSYQVILTVTDDLNTVHSDTTSAEITDPASAVMATAPAVARIAGIYPNPFNPTTSIQYIVGRSGPVRIEIYSVKGERVRVLLHEEREAGAYTLRWNGTAEGGRAVPSGAYLCRIVNGGQVDTQPLLLLK